MKSLFSNIENIIQDAVSSFAHRVAEKYELDADEVLELWTEDDEVREKVAPKVAPKKAVPVAPKKVAVAKRAPSPAKSDADANGEGCPYVYTKGDKEGDICGSNPKSGATYCSRHKKYEGTEPKTKKVLPASKKSISATVKTKKSPAKKAVNTVLRKHKTLGQLWHSDTGMVFRSPKDRTVIGKVVNDKLEPLDEDDIELCKAHSFKYEEKEEKEEEEEEEVEEVEEDVEEEDVEEEEDEAKVAIATKAARKVTAVPNVAPKKVAKTVEVAPKKVAKIVEVAHKKTLVGKNAKSVKKSIAAAIAETKIQAEDVEDILGELQTNPCDLVAEKVAEEEEDTFTPTDDEAGDDEEEYEEELLEEEDEEDEE